VPKNKILIISICSVALISVIALTFFAFQNKNGVNVVNNNDKTNSIISAQNLIKTNPNLQTATSEMPNCNLKVKHLVKLDGDFEDIKLEKKGVYMVWGDSGSKIFSDFLKKTNTIDNSYVLTSRFKNVAAVGQTSNPNPVNFYCFPTSNFDEFVTNQKNYMQQTLDEYKEILTKTPAVKDDKFNKNLFEQRKKEYVTKDFTKEELKNVVTDWDILENEITDIKYFRMSNIYNLVLFKKGETSYIFNFTSTPTQEELEKLEKNNKYLNEITKTKDPIPLKLPVGIFPNQVNFSFVK